VSGTLKSAETRKMLLPFSIECITVPVFAFGPSNFEDVWVPLAAKETLAVTSVATSAKTDNMRLSFTVVLL
jgi:hypothetical protein